MRPRYFAARYFAGRFFVAVGADAEGYYFGSRHFGANYFNAGFYGPVTLTTDISASLDATESADTLESTASHPQVSFVGGFSVPSMPMPRLPTIIAALVATERGDTLESTVELGFDPVAMDNDWLLVAA